MWLPVLDEFRNWLLYYGNEFGELLKEIQRIKSEGDYEAGKNLVETYGVKVDKELHKEVLDRYKLGNCT